MTWNKYISKLLSMILIITLVGMTGCSKDIETNQDSQKPIVAVSIVPQQTFVEAVCGDLVEVVTLVPPGSSPESYEPTAETLEKFSKSSVYFSIGVPTEEANIVPKAGDIKIVSLQEEVASKYEDRLFPSGERDPHIWLSPKRAVVMVEAIAREMSEIDEEHKDVYEKNAKAYIEQLETLDQEIIKALEGVENRKFIVYHPAFGYIASDYNLEMFALEEEGKEATASHLQEMIDLAKEENIKVIFYQSEIDSSQSKAYAEEVDGKTIQLAPLAANYIENLQNMSETMAEAMK